MDDFVSRFNPNDPEHLRAYMAWEWEGKDWPEDLRPSPEQDNSLTYTRLRTLLARCWCEEKMRDGD